MYSRIKELRKEMGLSQTEMGRLLGIQQRTLSSYECGINDIPTAVLIRLSAVLNTSIDYLLGQTNMKRRYPPADFDAVLADEEINKATKRTRRASPQAPSKYMNLEKEYKTSEDTNSSKAADIDKDIDKS